MNCVSTRGFNFDCVSNFFPSSDTQKKASTTGSFPNDCVTQLVCERSLVKKRQKAFQTKLYIDETFHRYGGAVIKHHEYFILSK